MKIRAGLTIAISAAAFLILFPQQANAGCRDYPESVTPACVAQNLAEEQIRQAEYAARMEQMRLDSIAAEKANSEAQYVANGSRPCSLYPASISPACVTENLSYEAVRQAEEVARIEGLTQEAKAAELKQQKADYIRNGSRPCSVYPASVTAACVEENLAYEEVKKVESLALADAKEALQKSTFATLDENGSLLVQAKISTKVDLLSTKVKLLNSKGKVVNTGVIRYLASGEPYFVFDNFTGTGNYKVQLSLPNKKFSTISIKVTK
jgi:hypothetical protein